MSKPTKIRRRKAAHHPPATDPRQARAMLLDRLADQMLQHGLHRQAERLAHQAAAMREIARP